MGQTLENGVYLPSEGERNCYAGLKTNWEILDQKVADVTALQQAVAGALHREIVESLPTTDIDPNTIYMILSGTSATENVYNEYMYVNNAWELIGTSATDLTNYYTKSEVDGKLLLKASASDLTSHTGDTTIHVTTADKTKWNNQAFVFRYSSTALVASSTNSNTLLDNTDNLKVGDKVIDSSGVLFSVTAIDTANSTFTIGASLIDLAQDSDVVHTSGNETISGAKTFSDNLTIYNSDDTQTPKGLTIRNAQWGMGESGGTTVSNINFSDKNSAIPVSIIASKGISGQSFLRFSVRTKDSQNNTYAEEIYYNVDTSGNVSFRPWHDNIISLGTSVYRWKDLYTNKINGLEPSSLSLPSGNASDVIDISSYITDMSGNVNSYTVPANGWISIAVVGIAIAIASSSWSDSRFRSGSGNVRMLYPVLKNETVSILITGTTLAYARFIPCQGNV